MEQAAWKVLKSFHQKHLDVGWTTVQGCCRSHANLEEKLIIGTLWLLPTLTVFILKLNWGGNQGCLRKCTCMKPLKIAMSIYEISNSFGSTVPDFISFDSLKLSMLQLYPQQIEVMEKDAWKKEAVNSRDADEEPRRRWQVYTGQCEKEQMACHSCSLSFSLSYTLVYMEIHLLKI